MNTKFIYIIIFLASIFLLPLICLGVSVEEGETGGHRVLPAHPPIPHYPSCCADGGCLDCLEKAMVAKPIRIESLLVYPVVGSSCADGSYMTMDEALNKGALVVTEGKSAQVPFLTAENKSGRHILIMGGEMMLGGKQNRIVSQDILLPPNSGPIQIPVFCGERNRWTDGHGKFSGKQLLAPAKLRGQVYSGTDQNQVWTGISSRMEKSGASSPTENMESLYESGEFAKSIAKWDRKVKGRFPFNTIGMIIYQNGRLAGVEIFANRALFSKLHKKVLHSYYADFLITKSHRHLTDAPPPNKTEAQAVLREILRARFTPHQTIGAGCLSGLLFRHHTGQALFHNHGLVHLSAISRTKGPVIPGNSRMQR